MNGLVMGIKKFFQNKNIVTILGILIILGLLYWGYTSTINAQVAPTNVPVATRTIQPRTQITSEMVTTIKVPSKSISENVLKNTFEIIGKYTAVNTVIPQGSMFYSDVIVEAEDLPDSAFVNVKDGERPYALGVNTQSTYGNSIFPGNIVDIFMKATDENGQVMVGRLLAQVEVLAIKDSSGNNVFEDTSQNRTPATLLFGCPDDVFTLLKKAEYLKNYGVELFPVPYGGYVQIPSDLIVDREELVEFIQSHTVVFSNEGDLSIPDQNNDEVVE